MKVWNFITNNLQEGIPVTLLYVLNSKGSSPGRKGFLMAVNQKGVFEGTIGGGIMEVKMIELAKAKMEKADQKAIVKKQHHDKSRARNQSGLICSGEQTVALIPLKVLDINSIKKIINSHVSLSLRFNSTGLFEINASPNKEETIINSEEDFEITLKIKPPKTIHIFGAGHVGLALARQMRVLNYRIFQYDDRPNLPILAQNSYASELRIIDYGNLADETEIQETDIVVIASFSYRSDKLILQQIYDKQHAYIGMMGSDAKIATLRKELANEGISEKAIEHVFMPIGLNMYSKTAEEIAVSIAGQIIYELNKELPTGRSY